MVLIRALFDSLFRQQSERMKPVTQRWPLMLFHVDSGGCEGCGLEIEALAHGGYGLAEAALGFVETPRAADVLLVTGACTRMMAPAVEAAWTAMPGPKALVAVGACAIDGGPFGENYAVMGGLQRSASVNLAIPGCPPEPRAVLAGIATVLETERRG